jgi:TolB protein
MPHPTSRRRALAASLLSTLGVLACGPGETYRSGQVPGPTTPEQVADPQSSMGVSGRLLYVADSDLHLWERGAARRLTRDRVTRQPAWSPDGKKIAHIKIDVSSSELWVMDADGANARTLTDNFSKSLAKNNWAFRPSWWPDGSRILFLTEAASNDLMLWQVQLDGKNLRPYVTIPDFEGGLDAPSVSPDGRRLLAVSYRTAGAKSQIFSFALPGGPWRQLTEHPDGAYDPVWSHDGARFAYTVRNKGKHDIWVASADAVSAQPVTDAGACRAPCWSPDGQQIAHVSGEGATFDVSVVPSTGGARRQLTRGVNVDAVSGLSWAK